MNAHTQEQLARWVAVVLDDEIAPSAFGGMTRPHVVYSGGIPQTFSEYTSDLNVAGRLREWAVRNVPSIKEVAASFADILDPIQAGNEGWNVSTGWTNGIVRFDQNIWTDTPSAILALAEACGFTVEQENE